MRRALLPLYRSGLSLPNGGLDDIIHRTEGVTASFIKEFFDAQPSPRRAAMPTTQQPSMSRETTSLGPSTNCSTPPTQ